MLSSLKARVRVWCGGAFAHDYDIVNEASIVIEIYSWIDSPCDQLDHRCGRRNTPRLW